MYRVKKRLIFEAPSQKTLKVAKKYPSAPGLPKPLTSEEDFILEQNNSFIEYLQPDSSFYKLPQVPGCKFNVKFEDYNPRDIVGPFENFRKQWKNMNEHKEKDLMRKGRSLIAFTNPTLVKQNNFFKTENFQDNKPEVRHNKVHYLFEKQQDYWKRITQNIERRVTVKKPTKKTNFLTIPSEIVY
jgi:hypothetical protein